MDLIAEQLVGKELREIQHTDTHDTIIAFEDGAITAWTKVIVETSFGPDPIKVIDLDWSDEWCNILLSTGNIRISRVPSSPNPECFFYGSANDPSLMIVDRGDE